MARTTEAVRLVADEPISPASDLAKLTTNLAVETTQLAELEPGQVLVEPLFTGICGSDNSAALAKPNFSWVQRPRTLGHEFAARVVQTSAPTDIPMPQEGETVCILPMRGCGQPNCRACNEGRSNYCRRKKIFGFHHDGGMARQTVVDAWRCVSLRSELTPLQGAVVEPLSVAAQAIRRRCQIDPGMQVVVTGCGIIGLMAAELARDAGARVAVTGLARDRDVRLALARARGFLTIVVGPENSLADQLREGIFDDDGNRFGDPQEDGLVDLVIECSGAGAALATANQSLQLQGTICVIATYPQDVPFPATALTRAGQSVVGVMGSDRADFDAAQEYLARGVFPVDAYVQTFPFADALEAFRHSISAQTPKAILAINP